MYIVSTIKQCQFLRAWFILSLLKEKKEFFEAIKHTSHGEAIKLV